MELSVVLDGNGTARAGAEISGKAVIALDKPKRCKGLKLTLERRIRGKTTNETATVGETTLFAGEWPAGRHEYPFALALPVSPFTYAGPRFALDYYVRAEADVPWGRDPSHEVRIRVTPGPAPADDSDMRAQQEREHRSTHSSSKRYVMALLGLGTGVLLMWLGTVMNFVFLTGFGALVGIMGILLVVIANRNRIAALSMGRMRAELLPAVIGRDQPVTVRLTCSKPGKLVGLQCRLTCVERAIRKSNSGLTVHRVVHQDVVTELIPAGDGVFQAAVELFEPAPLSFHTQAHRIGWTATVKVKPQQGPDWTQALFLWVTHRGDVVGEQRE